MVLVDPEGADDLDEGLRRRVYDYVDALRMTGREHVVLAAEYVPLEVELVLCAQPGFARHLVRDRVLAELRPGSSERPGWFHPDRLSFGDAVRLGDLLAFVQGIAGVRSVEATIFRPLGDTTGPAVRDIILLGRTKVARLDADPDFPEHGTLEVLVAGLDCRRRPVPAVRRLAHHRHRTGTRAARRSCASAPSEASAWTATAWRMNVEEVVAAIGRGERFYVEEPIGDPVDVTIAHTAEGRVYLRTRGRRRRAEQPARPPGAAR